VHRDIKPANIHVGRLGLVCDFVKVLDFGLVKPIADRSVEQSLTTQAGLIVGTPGYMAPEMVLSDSVDGRADLYALGCVGYYLLTSQQVFDGDTPMKVLAKHLHEPPIPPSQRVPNGVPPRMEEVILACLAKKPEDRPRSAAALARLLTAADVEPWTSDQATEWWATATRNAGPRESADRTVTSAQRESQPAITSSQSAD
jgi:serine/threonine-protein kinase